MTIGTRGVFSLNEAAYLALDRPAAVEFLYDRERGVAGLRQADPSSPNAYTVRHSATGHTHSVSGTAFVRHYGIQFQPARRREAKLEGDVLCLDMNDPGIVVTSNRAGDDQ